MVFRMPWAAAWLPLSMLLAALSSSPALASQLPGLGEPALNYTHGRFTEPNGNTPSYGTGAMMNISWTTTYSACNLYLVHNEQWTAPVQIATNYQLSYLEWTIKTDQTNSSAIYNFRVVDAQGTVAQQQAGGFLSAAFLISGGPEPSATPVSGDGAPVSTNTGSSKEENSKGGLNTEAKLGIGLGVALGVAVLLILAGCFVWFRRSRRQKQHGGGDVSSRRAELPTTDSSGHLHHDYKGGGDTSSVAELHGYDRGSEMPAISSESELPADIPGAELPAELPPHLFTNKFSKDGTSTNSTSHGTRGPQPLSYPGHLSQKKQEYYAPLDTRRP